MHVLSPYLAPIKALSCYSSWDFIAHDWSV